MINNNPIICLKNNIINKDCNKLLLNNRYYFLDFRLSTKRSKTA